MKMRHVLYLLLLFVTVCFTVQNASAQRNERAVREQTTKYLRLLQMIDAVYVDTVDLERLTEDAIIKVLADLDPHSVYISRAEVEEANEPLEGGFFGIGIQFAMFRDTLLVVDVVAGGLHDTLGLLRRTSAVERDRCMAWMRLFGADAWADVPYTRLSSGEQRLVLLVRAFVKSPPLLVLDEPFQGLDDARLLRARALLDAYVRTGHHTLIMVSHYENELPPCIDRRLHLVKHDEN